MAISVVSFKLLVGLQPNLVWLYSIISRSVLWTNPITAFKVKVTANVNDCLSVDIFLNHRTFCYHIWYGDAASLASHAEFYFVVVAVFKVKVTARVCMIKTRLFLLCYLNCWFLGNQTWSDDALSETRVSCEKKKWITAFRVKVTVKGHIVNVYPDDIF